MGVSRRNSIEKIISFYEKKQELIVRAAINAVALEMDLKAEEVAYLFSKRSLRRGRYLPVDVLKSIERIAAALNTKIKQILLNSITESFLNSEIKGNEIEKFTFRNKSGNLPRGAGKLKVEGPYGNKKKLATAVNGFMERKENGFTLSSRIWKLSNQWKSTMNKTLTEGLKVGTSARKLAPQLKSALRNQGFNPNPGQGVYRSPMKNAFRLARNENNLAYAFADYERWQMIETVVGIEVRLSNAHPKYDICDEMKGRYPKDFKFTKWHPNCLCIAVPILAPQSTRDALMDYKLGLKDKKPEIKYIDRYPDKAEQWMKNNAERVDRWKSKPYWVRENKSRLKEFLKK